MNILPENSALESLSPHWISLCVGPVGQRWEDTSALSVCLLSLVIGNHSRVTSMCNTRLSLICFYLGIFIFLSSTRPGFGSPCPTPLVTRGRASIGACCPLHCTLFHSQSHLQLPAPALPPVLQFCHFSDAPPQSSWSQVVYNNKSHFQLLKSLRLFSVHEEVRGQPGVWVLTFRGTSCCFPSIDQGSWLMRF